VKASGLLDAYLGCASASFDFFGGLGWLEFCDRSDLFDPLTSPEEEGSGGWSGCILPLTRQTRRPLGKLRAGSELSAVRR
jgi:hypothetical protein